MGNIFSDLLKFLFSQLTVMHTWTSQAVLVIKNLPANAKNTERLRLQPWVGKILWRRVWQPTPVFLPEESHAQRSLEGYSPQRCKELDKTEETQPAHMHTCIKFSLYINQKIIMSLKVQEILSIFNSGVIFLFKSV